MLEFYASAEGEAILANLSGRAVGSMGKPLPGTAEVRVAAYDLEADRLLLAEDGLGRECRVDEVGLLLARANPADTASEPPLRGVFESGDAWRSTGDLFLRDEHGDLWLAGPGGRGRATPQPGRRSRPAPGSRSAPCPASTSWSPTACRTATRRCSSAR